MLRGMPGTQAFPCIASGATESETKGPTYKSEENGSVTGTTAIFPSWSLSSGRSAPCPTLPCIVSTVARRTLVMMVCKKVHDLCGLKGGIAAQTSQMGMRTTRYRTLASW